MIDILDNCFQLQGVRLDGPEYRVRDPAYPFAISGYLTAAVTRWRVDVEY